MAARCSTLIASQWRPAIGAFYSRLFVDCRTRDGQGTGKAMTKE
jgi:hypothetical protein